MNNLIIYITIPIITYIFIIIFSSLSHYLKLIDLPNNRKLHKGAVPLVGGISIYLSILVVLPFLNLNLFFTYQKKPKLRQNNNFIWYKFWNN